MYKCQNCNKTFNEDEAGEVHTTYEAEYGVSGELASRSPLNYLVCPYCKSDDLEECEEDEDEE